VSLGETTITRATCASRIPAIAHAFAGHPQRHPVARIETLREQLELLGPALDPAGRSQPAAFDDRDLAEVAVNIQRHCSHLVLLACRRLRRTGGQATSTDPRSQRNRASRRGGH
jgi:hypothetical protein